MTKCAMYIIQKIQVVLLGEMNSMLNQMDAMTESCSRKCLFKSQVEKLMAAPFGRGAYERKNV